MKKILISILMVFILCPKAFTQVTQQQKPRIIYMNDDGADPDNQQSMVHFLVQSDEFDVEGLIVVTSCWKQTQSNTNILNNVLDAYGKVVSNLKVHDSEFPSLKYLQSVSKLGQPGYGMSDVGLGKDSPGSNLIISVVDKDDPRPVWICTGGGINTLAQALWQVKNTRSADELQKFISKIRVYDILGQDDAGAWIAKTFPNILYIRATGVYGWQPSDSWLKSNIQNEGPLGGSQGPLGAIYPDRKYATEGDSPSFMYLFPNGLHNPDEIWQGSWGGRFERDKKADIRGMSPVSGEAQYDPYYMYGNTQAGADDISRWAPAYNNDFKVRMEWSITSNYSDANHDPIAIVNGDSTKQVLEVAAAPGSIVNLSAAGSFDPDSNTIYYNWFYYKDPSTYIGRSVVTIDNSNTAAPTVHVPPDADSTELNIILELHDSGSPSLYAYRRVIINVSSSTGIEKFKSDMIPQKVKLYQNFPNPFNPETAINYELSNSSFVSIQIFNTLGEKINTLVNKYQTAGRYEINWQPKNLSSGIYFYKLKAHSVLSNKEFVQIKKMIYLK